MLDILQRIATEGNAAATNSPQKTKSQPSTGAVLMLYSSSDIVHAARAGHVSTLASKLRQDHGRGHRGRAHHHDRLHRHLLTLRVDGGALWHRRVVGSKVGVLRRGVLVVLLHFAV